MSKARKIAEQLGINLQPSQMGYVPSKPPRAMSGYNPEPDEELSMPITVDKNNRRRQVKALNGIKRKFESRYGNVNEDLTPEQKAALDKFRQRNDPEEYERRRQEIEAFKRARIPDYDKKYGGGQPATPTAPVPTTPSGPRPGESYIEWAKRRRTERVQQYRTDKPQTYKDWNRVHADRERERQRQRDAIAARHRAEEIAAQRRGEGHKYNPEIDRINRETARMKYMSDYRDLGTRPQNAPGEEKRGVWGRGRQKEADRIAQALFTKTRFKNVVIKPHGSGARATMKISLEPKDKTESGDIELFLQRNLQMILFTRVSTPREGMAPLLSSAIKTIIEATPLDWKIAIDPFLRQKSVGSQDRNVKVGVRVLLSVASSLPGDRLVSRQDFMRINRDFRNKTRTDADAQTEAPPGSGAGGLGAAKRVDWEYADPGMDPRDVPPVDPNEPWFDSNGFPRNQAARVQQEKERLEADRLAREAEEQVAARAASGRNRQWQDVPGGEDQEQSFMRGYGGMGGYGQTDYYSDPDQYQGYGPDPSAYGGGYGSGIGAGGGLGGDLETYKSRSQERQDRREAQARERAEQQFSQTDYTEQPDYHVPRSDSAPWARYDQNVGQRPSSSRMSQDVPRPTKKRSKSEPDPYMVTSDPDDLMNQARMDTAGPGRRFSSESPAVQFIARQMKRAFGSADIIDASTSTAKVIVRSPGIEAHLTRKKYKGAYLQVTLEFKNLDFNKWADVFAKLPTVAFPSNMAGNPGKKYPTTHKTSLKTLIQEVKDRKDPRVMRGMVDALEKWAAHMKARTASGLSGANIIINWREQQRKKADRAARDERMRARNESKAARFNHMILSEQLWYKEFLPLARKIQEWLLRHLGSYQVTCDEIHARFGADHNDEAINKAIEILRANAGIYPMTNDTYMINMSRLSSALM